MSSQAFNRVALTRELPGDLDTPVGAYLKLANRPFSYLLESMQGGEQWGRYSFIGLPCRETVEVRGQQITVRREGRVLETAVEKNPLDWLRGYAQRVRVKPDHSLPRFNGGLVGFFGYECVRYFEPRLDEPKADPLGTPDILLMLSDELVAFDNLRATATVIVHADPDSAQDMERARKRRDQIEQQLAAPLNAALHPVRISGRTPDFVSSMGRDKFCDAV